MRRPVRDAERDREDGESEQLARAGARDLVQDPRHDASPADQHQRDEHRDFERGHAQAESAASPHRCRHRSRAQAGTPTRGPLRDPRRSASPLRCGRSPCRARCVARAHATARPCSRPTARDRTRARRTDLQPHQRARPAPIAVATAICATAPGSAIARTRSSVEIEKCRPTPNISRMTPISASSEARLASATKPGVNGPIAMPATQVADERRQAHARGEESESEREHEADGDQRDEFGFVGHRPQLYQEVGLKPDLQGACWVRLSRLSFTSATSSGRLSARPRSSTVRTT